MIMNPEAQKYLDEILSKTPEEITEDQAKFLRARRSYLKKPQLEEFDSILNPKTKPSKKKTVKKNGKKD